MLTVAFLLSAISCGLQPLPQEPPFRFLQERIVFSVNKDSCRVDAVYHFSNDGDETSASNITYPFPLHRDLPFPVIERVEDDAAHSPLPFSRRDSSLLFRVSIPPHSTRSIHIVYQQPTQKHAMEYILTTTWAWKEPLRSAEFIIILPRSENLTRLSHEMTRRVSSSTVDSIFIQRTQFMPRTNLKFSWMEKP